MAQAIWITNSPTAAKALRKADANFEKAMKAASGMALAQKIVAIRSAKAARDAAYSSVGA